MGIVGVVYNIYSIIQAGQQLQPMKSVQIVTEADKILELCIMENHVNNTTALTNSENISQLCKPFLYSSTHLINKFLQFPIIDFPVFLC